MNAFVKTNEWTNARKLNKLEKLIYFKQTETKKTNKTIGKTERFFEKNRRRKIPPATLATAAAAVRRRGGGRHGAGGSGIRRQRRSAAAARAAGRLGGLRGRAPRL